MMADRAYLQIGAAILLPNLGGILNGYVTRKNIKPWYETLKFPSFRPPNWVFAPVWISLYSGMGYASYLVWRDGGGFSGDAKLALAVYSAQFALNMAWTPVFFGRHDIKSALAIIIALTGTASACGALFFQINKVAGSIFVPYVAWLGFATALNYSICKLNRPAIDDKKH